EMRGSQPYFHINWGWGGLANAFFASDALNPSASRDYHFNDQTTIVYNIRPAESAGTWSPIHITSDGGQIGLTADVADMTPGTAFTVRAGALKNIANEDFSGSLAVALFDGAGTMKTLVSNPSGFGLGSLQIRQYVDFSCDIPANANIAEGDCIKLVTKANGSDSWLPVAGELIVAGEAAATGYQIPYFSVQMPAATDGVVISATENRVIKGRDFKFNVTSTDADKLVTVRANGFIITPDASGNYRLGNVNSDQTITVTVQNAADVIAKRSLWVTAGNLSSLINEADAGTIKDLTLYGTIDANDFTFIRERMKVERLDLSQTRILANGGNPANAIPAKAFYWYGSLREIKLPSGLTNLKSGCFTGTELT
ncbi:MAG: leucine-rich repeat domain-containing protein, partial [Muribaculaceae bacterium]|nr:leucine-rich repeat domain-containing protein [Muribaculaceae bacterium]